MKRIVTVLAVAVALVAVPAASQTRQQVEGTSTPNPDGFTATMTGSLDGIWVFESLERIWGGGQSGRPHRHGAVLRLGRRRA